MADNDDPKNLVPPEGWDNTILLIQHIDNEKYLEYQISKAICRAWSILFANKSAPRFYDLSQICYKFHLQPVAVATRDLV